MNKEEMVKKFMANTETKWRDIPAPAKASSGNAVKAESYEVVKRGKGNLQQSEIWDLMRSNERPWVDCHTVAAKFPKTGKNAGSRILKPFDEAGIAETRVAVGLHGSKVIQYRAKEEFLNIPLADITLPEVDKIKLRDLRLIRNADKFFMSDENDFSAQDNKKLLSIITEIKYEYKVNKKPLDQIRILDSLKLTNKEEVKLVKALDLLNEIEVLYKSEEME